MGTTSHFQLPYPDPGSSVDVPRDVKALAESVDPKLLRVATGTFNVYIAAGSWSSYGWTVTYPAGRFVTTPILVTNCADVEYYSTSVPVSPTGANVAASWNVAQPLGAPVTPTINYIAIEIPGLVTGLRALPFADAVNATVICHTGGCGNADIPLVVPISNPDEFAVACGVCGQPITDVVMQESPST
jgi:hypothetical protein